MRKRKQIDPEEAERIRKFALTCYGKDCSDMFEKTNLICCTKCRRCYHTTCNEPPLIYDIVSRFSWHCDRCKICIICCTNEKDKETTLIICDACDRAYHIECMEEKIVEIPEGDWYCDDCQYCKICDLKLPHEQVIMANYSIEGNKLCTSCKDQRLFFKKLTAHLANTNSTSSGRPNDTTRNGTSTSSSGGGTPTAGNSGRGGRDINIAAIVVNNQRKYVRIKEFCCVCSKPIEGSSTPGNSRVTCPLCRQGSHTRCSLRVDDQGETYRVATWICKNCHKIRSSLFTFKN